MASKRKRSSGITAISDEPSNTGPSPLPSNLANSPWIPQPPRRQSSRKGPPAFATSTNPDANPDILDGPSSLRPSPDGGDLAPVGAALKPHKGKFGAADASGNSGSATQAATPALLSPTAEHSLLSSASTGHGRAKRRAGDVQRHATSAPGPASETAAADLLVQEPGLNKKRKAPSQHVKVDSADTNKTAFNAASRNGTAQSRDAVDHNVGVIADPEDPEDNQRLPPGNGEDEEDDIQEALSRRPPVNSDYLPLPWKGRLGYACLNTYLRNANPPVFSSRTCRMASILEHRHPLKDPSQPEHATRNRPDKDQPADVARGQRYVEELGLANARDIIKMIRWNDRYGIKFMRLSSEMFPFASHDEHGYKLAPFATDTLAEVGRVVAELGHRVTTHPGQFTQLGSPRKQVIENSIRDLDYHNEMLSLLKLPPQQDRDAVMILHLGGAFGDKPATLDRFRENYARLSQSVKNRLVLENDDVVWSVHELLPLCQELNIPFVLDFHHHNIIFDATQIREGTKDIVDLFPAILKTWERKNITPKMHYSEPCPDAITNRSRRKHSPRVMTLPPCPDTMDLMIEAKDKEQAVFELMRTFKLPGHLLFSDIIPHVRQDENKPFKPKQKKTVKKGNRKKADALVGIETKPEEAGEEGQLPPLIPDEEVSMGGPEGRVYWPLGMEEWLRPPKRVTKKEDGGVTTPAAKKRKTVAIAARDAGFDNDAIGADNVKTTTNTSASRRAVGLSKKKIKKAIPTPEPSYGDSSPLSEVEDEEEGVMAGGRKRNAAHLAPTRHRSGRVAQRVSYKEEDADSSV